MHLHTSVVVSVVRVCVWLSVWWVAGQGDGHGCSVIRGTTGGSCTPWIGLLRSRGGWTGVRWAGVRQEGGCVVREKGGIDRISVSVCLPGCRRHVSWAYSPDPHPTTPFHHPSLSRQSVMDQWFREGGGARPVSSTPQQPALLGFIGDYCYWIMEGLPLDQSLAGSRDGRPSHNCWCVTFFSLRLHSPPHTSYPPILFQPRSFSHAQLA